MSTIAFGDNLVLCKVCLMGEKISGDVYDRQEDKVH